jgi:Flp pilus assembly protein TadD
MAALADPKQDALDHYSKGQAAYQAGDCVRAIAEFTQAIQLNPHDPKTYDARGLAYLGTKETNRAIADFTEAIRLNPRDAEAYSNGPESSS